MSSDPQRVQAIFIDAVQKAEPERSDFLERECGGDSELRRRVDALLAAHDQSGSFLDSPPKELAGTSPTVALSEPEQAGSLIGQYKLLQQIGEGGMGSVFMAEQIEPVERRVALKIIKPGMDTKTVVARFEAERQALAMMDHPNIAKVLDVGTTNSGRPYFVMELVRGVPITQYCDDHHLTPRERLGLFLPVCQAVQHAHQKGIIHRDIKPSNVLVAEYDDRAVPKIIDFGLAKAMENRLTAKTMFTEFGQIVGTPDYMSPEHAKLNQMDIDTRSDIYSLGVLLYELLSGNTPFDRQRLRSAAFDELLRIIRDEEPPKPSQRLSTVDTLPSIAANRRITPAELTRQLSGELDWIVMKTLEKERSRRYDTAKGLVNDIRRFLDDEPVLACPPSQLYLLRKFARRNRASLAFAAAGFLVLVLIALGSAFAARGFRLLAQRNAELVIERTEALAAETEAKNAATRAFRNAEEAREAAVNARFDSEYNLYIAEIGSAHADWKVGLVAHMLELLSKHVPDDAASDIRGWEWYYLQSLMSRHKLAFREHSDVVGAVAWSHDGSRIASGDWSGVVRIWDSATGAELHQLRLESPIIADLEWSHDDQVLAAISATNAVEVWNAMTWELEFRRIGTQGATRTVPMTAELAWNPVKTQLAFKGEREVLFWTPDSADELQRLETRSPTTSLAWDRTGELLAMGFFGGPVEIWKIATAEREHQIDTGLINIHGAIGFSADNQLLAVGNDKGYVTVWKWRTEEVVHLFEHDGPVDTIDWQPVGSHLAVGSRGQQIRVWNVDGGALITTFQGHTHWITSIAWNPDGELLVSAGGGDRELRIWQFASGGSATRKTIGLNLSETQSLQREENGELVICNTASGQDVCVLPANTDPGLGTFWSPDEQLLRVRLPDAVHIRDAKTGRLVVELPRARYVVWSPDSRMVACLVKETQDLFVCDARSGIELLRMNCAGILHDGYRWSSDSKLLAAQRDNHSRLSITRVTENREALSIQARNLRSLAFSPDGQYIAFSEPDLLRIWHISEGCEVHALPHALGGHQYVFWGPDSSLIALGGVSGPVDVWDLEKEEKKFILRGHSAMIAGLAFSPDGSRIASGAQDHTVRIWDAMNGRQVLLLDWEETHNPSVRQWSPDGKKLVIQRGGGDWATVFLDATPGYEMEKLRLDPSTELRQ